MRNARLDCIEVALDAIAKGRPVIAVDDFARENEGDFIMAAEAANADWMRLIIRRSSGIVCAAMTDERADELRLPPMVERNEDPRATAFTVTVDAAEGIATGVSGADRARTMRLLADPATKPDELRRPGHVFPLRARARGVLERKGHTEAAVDLCRLAGRRPVGLLAEVMRDDGEMMRLPELMHFGRQHGLKIISVADLIQYRLEIETPFEIAESA